VSVLLLFVSWTKILLPPSLTSLFYRTPKLRLVLDHPSLTVQPEFLVSPTTTQFYLGIVGIRYEVGKELVRWTVEISVSENFSKVWGQPSTSCHCYRY